nr:hypothetical protein [Tanacetum cinerariifolium]
GSSGRITGKGKIKAGRLDFEDVYYVEELKHCNLFSVSQMCDKKNKVLFTDTDCLVPSPDFKLSDKNQVLLTIPRQHNMYSFNLKNIDPSGDLSCLFVKASIDKSNKWHRRLGHVNFKNLNKLVKGNLVRGLPSKFFENAIPVLLVRKESNTRPLARPRYRFSWVYCLKSKDETTPIIKDFIRQDENQFNHMVKTSRSDNGTEFKNNDLIEFCGLKGIKREYSNARTPQQIRVAERKNMTLIEAARTMLAVLFLPTTFWAEAVNTACLKEANNSVCTQANDDQDANSEEINLHEEHFVLPIWSAYSTTVKSSRDKIEKNIDFKTSESPRKEATHDIQNASTSSTNLINSASTPLSTVDPLRAFNDGNGHAWIFDLDYLTNSMNYEPVSVENQANKSEGLKEANNSVGTQANDDQDANSEEINLPEEHFVLPIWSAYSTTVKSSRDKIEKNIDFKTCEKPVSQVEQIFLEEFEKLKDRKRKLIMQLNHLGRKLLMIFRMLAPAVLT